MFDDRYTEEEIALMQITNGLNMFERARFKGEYYAGEPYAVKQVQAQMNRNIDMHNARVAKILAYEEQQRIEKEQREQARIEREKQYELRKIEREKEKIREAQEKEELKKYIEDVKLEMIDFLNNCDMSNPEKVFLKLNDYMREIYQETFFWKNMSTYRRDMFELAGMRSQFEESRLANIYKQYKEWVRTY